MLKIIADDHGEDLANAVADQLIYSSIRTDQDTQRLSIPTRIGVRHPKLSRVIQIMEQQVEEPISPATLAHDAWAFPPAARSGCSGATSTGSPSGITWSSVSRRPQPTDADEMSVINVRGLRLSVPSHFSKCYRAHYGTRPTASVAPGVRLSI
jgi:hypothetical protein